MLAFPSAPLVPRVGIGRHAVIQQPGAVPVRCEGLTSLPSTLSSVTPKAGCCNFNVGCALLISLLTNIQRRSKELIFYKRSLDPKHLSSSGTARGSKHPEACRKSPRRCSPGGPVFRGPVLGESTEQRDMDMRRSRLVAHTLSPNGWVVVSCCSFLIFIVFLCCFVFAIYCSYGASCRVK